ncbi:MAG: pantoate--beta-alanine ligase [candidate division WOR-3 bacterium]|nr:pantoate--beta-alanine ligase [candidate division WOR-3 bacterium]
MEIIRDPRQMHERAMQIKCSETTLGFVPTMGALHDGHISLVRQCVNDNDMSVVSIFVNPSQFAPGEDFDKYPRSEGKDTLILENENCDIVFIPDRRDMYFNHLTTVRMEGITEKLCGKKRPGHFEGVATIVSKLFNIIMPQRAYFGGKDYQQYIVMKKMVFDLNFNVEIIGCPIVRESDGLAMSSRNAYLKPEHRKTAPALYRELKRGRDLLLEGMEPEKVVEKMKDRLKDIKDLKVDYIDILTGSTLQVPSENDKHLRIFAAVYIGETRLIDNIGVELE